MKHWITCLMACLLPLLASAQTEEWKLMHQGNKQFRNGNYDAAEKLYRAAQKKNPNDARAAFNLGDTYLAKKDVDAAMKQYGLAVKNEKNPIVRGMAHHNMGYIAQSAALGAKDEAQKQQCLQDAIAHYKNALRCNPRDENARYNLVLCQKQLKKGGQQNQKNQQQQKKQPQKQQDKNKDNRQDNSRQQPSKEEQQQQNLQVQQLLNLSRQSEQRTKQKVNNAQPRRQPLDKNW